MRNETGSQGNVPTGLANVETGKKHDKKGERAKAKKTGGLNQLRQKRARARAQVPCHLAIAVGAENGHEGSHDLEGVHVRLPYLFHF